MTKPLPETAQVLVVGAGPTGLVLALWLTRLGIRVRIIDKNNDAAPYSRALGVHARTLEFYKQLGFADEVVPQGIQVQGANLWAKGSKAAHVIFRDMGDGMTAFPFILDYAQDAHERLLIAKLYNLGVEIDRNTELVDLRESDGAVEATLRGASGEERCVVQYLAGCDGGHSTVREALHIGFSGGTYSRRFYVADVVATGPTTNDEIHLGLDTEDLLAIFPMKGEGHMRLVGTVRDEVLDELASELTFADVGDRVIKQVKLNVTRINWFSTYRVHHRVAEAFRKGSVFLAGDAAHVHSPVGAQGMNTGIGDAINLSWKLAAVLNGAPVSLLDSYAAERIPFAQRLVATTDRAFTLASKPGSFAAHVRTKVLPFVAPLAFRVRSLRRFFFRTLSQLQINYRSSPLSTGSAGEIHGGDRLPWMPLPKGDNLEPLCSLSWQVHVYGRERDDLRKACEDLKLSLHVNEWNDAMRSYGFARDAVYLIRPDGYVALADASGDAMHLRNYSFLTP